MLRKFILLFTGIVLAFSQIEEDLVQNPPVIMLLVREWQIRPKYIRDILKHLPKQEQYIMCSLNRNQTLMIVL